MNNIYLILFLLIFFSCGNLSEESTTVAAVETTSQISEGKKNPYLVVLGIAQDAGYPQASCKKECCQEVWSDISKRKMVSCLGLVDPTEGKSYLFDATPDFKNQLNILQKEHQTNLGGIFLTHAHMGHYTGLMHLGREAMGAKSIPVHAMPRLKNYLTNNGPWSQLVTLENISIQAMSQKQEIKLPNGLNVIPLLVPHRDEFSETVGFIIKGKKQSALFIPDIDKWSKWNESIVDLVREVDYAFLDGTFFENGEIPGRDMSLIPHPFIEESMNVFAKLSKEDKAKIYFIHFNHTNPVLKTKSKAKNKVMENGFNIAEERMTFDLK